MTVLVKTRIKDQTLERSPFLLHTDRVRGDVKEQAWEDQKATTPYAPTSMRLDPGIKTVCQVPDVG